MQLTFLSAPVALTKAIAFSARDGVYTTTPYPLIQRITSHEVTVSNIAEFAEAVVTHGAEGHALLKGHLDRPIKRESRAGHSVDAPHDWVCFDFDKVDCEPTFEGAMAAITKYLPKSCQNVDCIIQLSASCFVPTTERLSCHVFMLLDTLLEDDDLKHWFEWINFNSPLIDEVSLTHAGHTLHFPLDRTPCVASRLLYIAPPRCVGFTPTIDEAVKLWTGKHRKLNVGPITRIDSSTMRAKVDELRRAAGVDPVKGTIVKRGENEFISKLDELMTVSNIQKSGDEHIRFNLNGGDSHAYWIRLREPHIIGNFKGEPFMYTTEVAPNLYKALTKAAAARVPGRVSETIEPFLFYATNRESKLFLGSFDRASNDLRVEATHEKAAASWMATMGAPIPQMIPHMDLVTDMDSNVRYEAGYPFVNLYKPTEFVELCAQIEPSQKIGPVHEMVRMKCPVIYQTMFSALGSSITATQYFINWLAFILQTRDLSKTAWVMHGVQGTGKGFLFNHVIAPMFGETLVTRVLYNQLEDKFNGMIEGKLFVFVDEASMTRTTDREGLMSKLKDWISEHTIPIRGMFEGTRNATNRANWILASNSNKPVVIDNGDRRFNVGEKQTERLILTAPQYAALAQGTELMEFASALALLVVNQQWLLHPYEGESKGAIRDATHSLTQLIANAINRGETAFFFEHRPSSIMQAAEASNGRSLPYRAYDELLHRMQSGKVVMTNNDMYVLFRILCPDRYRFPEASAEQKKLYRELGLKQDGLKTTYDATLKKPVYGIAYEFKTDTHLYEQFEVPRPEIGAKLKAVK